MHELNGDNQTQILTEQFGIFDENKIKKITRNKKNVEMVKENDATECNENRFDKYVKGKKT